MQAGDLADGPLADILRTLAAAGATGGVHVLRRDAGTETETTRDAVLYLRDGRLYAATSPGPRPLLGVRLVSAGAVTREALEEALESQAGELAGWRLGELLVHLGYVDAEIVTEFVIEQILDTVAEVSSWPSGSWRFRRGEKTREADDLALEIDEVLTQVSERLAHWSNLAAWGSRADAVPVRISFDPEVEAAQMPLAQTLLREIDGRRPLADLAVRCGLTTFEAGQVLALLVESGAVRAGADDPGPTLGTDVPAPDLATPDLPTSDLPTSDLPTPDDVAASEPAPPEAAAPDLATSDFTPDGVPDTAPDTAPDAAPDTAPLEVVDDVSPPVVDHLDEPLADAGPSAEAETAPADDDLSALLGPAEDDLGLQLAILARQAEDARFAAEERRHHEVLAQRQGATAEAAPIALAPAPVEPITVAPLEPGQPAVSAVVPPLVPSDDLEPTPTEPVATDALDDLLSDLLDPLPMPAEAPAYQRILVEPLPGQHRAPEPDVVDQVEVAPLEVPAAEQALEPATAELSAPDPAAQVHLPDIALGETDMPDLASWAAALDATPAATVTPPPPSAPPVWTTPAPEVAEVAERADVAAEPPTVLDADPQHERAAIQAALSEVALTTFAEPDPEPEPSPEPEPQAAPEPDVERYGQHDDFAPAGDSPFADTASLLRELSSLGLDDAPPPAPAPRAPSPRPTSGGTATAAKTKRKSIFGR